jgi:hypothetical protein
MICRLVGWLVCVRVSGSIGDTGGVLVGSANRTPTARIAGVVGFKTCYEPQKKRHGTAQGERKKFGRFSGEEQSKNLNQEQRNEFGRVGGVVAVKKNAGQK